MPELSSTSTGSACGKIILSGDYAVVFGKRGIAMPSTERFDVSWTDDPASKGVSVVWESADVDEKWITYVHDILGLLKEQTGILNGVLALRSTIPLGKGMGSSTALIIALCRCLLGPHSAKAASLVENALNPGNSGLDFTVIWEEQPILYRRSMMPEAISLSNEELTSMRLIDTGSPNETTKELVAWMRQRHDSDDDARVRRAIEIIGECTERIVRGEPLKPILRDHHRAQVTLGVVPEETQRVIAEIEQAGGAAKVIGAGARTGGGGMVLVLD